jgi:putative phosphoesterase
VRVAALADIHGNLPALAAVLDEVERERVDVVVCCGDVAGPFGEQCVARLRALGGVRFVRGNADEGVDWPLTVELAVDGLGRVLFCHGSPRSEHEILTRISPPARVAAALAGVAADIVVGGHTHVQFDRSVAGHRLVNAGSVGMPYEGARGAYWALLGASVSPREARLVGSEGSPAEPAILSEGIASDALRPGVELRRTEYDVEAAAAHLEATGFPGAAEQAGWLRDPPDPTEVSAYFESQATGAGA